MDSNFFFNHGLQNREPYFPTWELERKYPVSECSQSNISFYPLTITTYAIGHLAPSQRTKCFPSRDSVSSRLDAKPGLSRSRRTPVDITAKCCSVYACRRRTSHSLSSYRFLQQQRSPQCASISLNNPHDSISNRLLYSCPRH